MFHYGVNTFVRKNLVCSCRDRQFVQDQAQLGSSAPAPLHTSNPSKCSDVGSRGFLLGGSAGFNSVTPRKSTECMPVYTPCRERQREYLPTLLIAAYQPTAVRSRLSYDRETHKSRIQDSYPSGRSTDRAAAATA